MAPTDGKRGAESNQPRGVLTARIRAEIADCRSYISALEEVGLGETMAPSYRARLAMLEEELRMAVKS